MGTLLSTTAVLSSVIVLMFVDSIGELLVFVLRDECGDFVGGGGVAYSGACTSEGSERCDDVLGVDWCVDCVVQGGDCAVCGWSVVVQWGVN